MNRVIKQAAIAIFVAWASFVATAAEVFRVPDLSGPVVDTADMLTPKEREAAAQLLAALWRDRGTQIAVLTVPNLAGLSIEEASIKVADAWQLGSKDKDNGILLLVARDERRMRIEVGQGFEGDLPDAYARRIIDQVMVPAFRAGKPGQGILLGLVAIIHKTNPDVDVSQYLGENVSQDLSAADTGEGISLGILPLLLIVGLVWFAITLSNSRAGRRRGRHVWYGGGWGGGGGGGWGGGGGYSGGGGGFSGGGASGGW